MWNLKSDFFFPNAGKWVDFFFRVSVWELLVLIAAGLCGVQPVEGLHWG